MQIFIYLHRPRFYYVELLFMQMRKVFLFTSTLSSEAKLETVNLKK